MTTALFTILFSLLALIPALQEPTAELRATLGYDVTTPWLLFYLVSGVGVVTGLAGCFQKAGLPWWRALVPVLAEVTLLRLCGRPAAWCIVLVLQIPIITMIATLVVLTDLAVRFRKGTLVALGTIFLPYVTLPWLGFGPAEFSPPIDRTRLRRRRERRRLARLESDQSET